MKKLLNKEEVQTILSMNIYWEEVVEREDTSPLRGELMQVVKMLGTRILLIVAEYAKSQERNKIKEEN